MSPCSRLDESESARLVLTALIAGFACNPDMVDRFAVPSGPVRKGPAAQCRVGPSIAMSTGIMRLTCYTQQVAAGCSARVVAIWCNWLTRRPLKAKSSGSSPDIATKPSPHNRFDHSVFSQRYVSGVNVVFRT